MYSDKPGQEESKDTSPCDKARSKYVPRILIEQISECWHLLVDSVNQT